MSQNLNDLASFLQKSHTRQATDAIIGSSLKNFFFRVVSDPQPVPANAAQEIISRGLMTPRVQEEFRSGSGLMRVTGYFVAPNGEPTGQRGTVTFMPSHNRIPKKGQFMQAQSAAFK